MKFRVHPDFHGTENLERLSLFAADWNPAGLSGRLEVTKLDSRDEFHLTFTGVRDGRRITARSMAIDEAYLRRPSLLPRLQGFAMRFAGAVSGL